MVLDILSFRHVIHHYRNTEGVFIVLKKKQKTKNLCALPTIIPLFKPPATTDLFVVSKVLLFLEFHIIEIIQYTAFQISFFSLSRMN